MKDYIFNEQQDIESMMEHHYVDEINICRTIKKLARYNHYVLGLNDKESYDRINEYMKQNCKDYTEVGFYKSIHGCIKDANKGAWRQVDHVVITQQELDTIRALNDDRQEKLAFVLLADAKYDNAYKGKAINLSYLNMSDLYRLARVTMPIKDRAIFLHFLYENGLVEMNLNPETVHKKLTYVSEQDDGAVIILDANNYKELAFTYMNWKYGGYKACKYCGRLFKAKKNTQYCKKCAPKYEKIEFRMGQCIDCGTEFEVDARNTTKCRCDVCQREYIKEYDRRRKKK